MPDIFGGTKCVSGKAGKITCDPSFYNRCMTTKYTTSLGGPLGPMSVELRNCSSSSACDPEGQWNGKCKKYGLLTKCEVNMAGYWPSSSFFCMFVDRDEVDAHKLAKKRMRPIYTTYYMASVCS